MAAVDLSVNPDGKTGGKEVAQTSAVLLSSRASVSLGSPDDLKAIGESLENCVHFAWQTGGS